MTSTVITQREQTAQDVAESQLNEVIAIGSNTQLNTGESVDCAFLSIF